jgi:hypothetical protein
LLELCNKVSPNQQEKQIAIVEKAFDLQIQPTAVGFDNKLVILCRCIQEMLGNKMGADLESKHATATNRLPDFPARLSKNIDISWVLMVLTEKGTGVSGASIEL